MLVAGSSFLPSRGCSSTVIRSPVIENFGMSLVSQQLERFGVSIRIAIDQLPELLYSVNEYFCDGREKVPTFCFLRRHLILRIRRALTWHTKGDR